MADVDAPKRHLDDFVKHANTHDCTRLRWFVNGNCAAERGDSGDDGQAEGQNGLTVPVTVTRYDARRVWSLLAKVVY